ncbi:MAG: hypothetical protein XXXJIFNMEKO3_02718 [Candidatus Erwinia impunctatus]|nr:hypothetical protein XXXJIFNMEKO_02718 [Culicoides impunctatus]
MSFVIDDTAFTVLPPICSLLISTTLSRDELCSALVGALYFQDKNRKGHILRCYDPRVLFHLSWMLTSRQLISQLSAHQIPDWTFWLDGQWHSLHFPADMISQPAGDIGLPLEQLQRVGLINRVLQKLPYQHHMRLRQDTSRKTDNLLIQAAMCGLLSEEDRIIFAYQGVTRGESFWQTPKMAAFLAQVGQSPDCYRDETQQWDEQRWQEMTQGHSWIQGRK